MTAPRSRGFSPPRGPAMAPRDHHRDTPPGTTPQPVTQSPEATPTPRQWWTGEDTPGALDLPPPPSLWEWWCAIFRESGYTSGAVDAVKRGPPPTPEGAVYPRPGQARVHRAWSAGWPGVYPAIAEVIRTEREAEHRAAMDAAKARREALVQKALDDDLQRQIALRDQHLAATMREGQIADALRAANLLGAAMSVKALDSVRALMERSAATWLAEGQTLSLADSVKLVKELGTTGRSYASMAGKLVETSRLAAGQSTVIIGGDSTAAQTAHPTDRAAAVEALEHIMQMTAGARGVWLDPGPPGPAGVAASGAAREGGTPETNPTAYEEAVEADARRLHPGAPASTSPAYDPEAGYGGAEGGPYVPTHDSPPAPPGDPGLPGAGTLAGPVVPQGEVPPIPSHPVTPGGGSSFPAVPLDGHPGGYTGGMGGDSYGGGMFG